MHDPRVRQIEGELVPHHQIEVYAGGVAGASPLPMRLPQPEGSKEPATKVQPYGFESYAAVVQVLSHRLGNTRISFGTSFSGGNQPEELPGKAGDQDLESFEPKPDDASKAGAWILRRDFGKNSSFYVVPQFEVDTVFKIKDNQRVMVWAGSRRYGTNAWNALMISAKADSIYFHGNHTFLAAGASYFLNRGSWKMGVATSFRHANDGDLALLENDHTWDFHDGWQAKLMLYGGVKKQKAVEASTAEDFHAELGWMSAYGGGLTFSSPRHWKLGMLFGTLQARDYGVDPRDGAKVPMDRHHVLAMPFAMASQPLKRGELTGKVGWYTGLQNYASYPGDAATVKRGDSLEVIAQWEFENEGPRHDLDLRVGLVYLLDSQRLSLPEGNALRTQSHLLIGILEFHFGGSCPLRKKGACR